MTSSKLLLEGWHQDLTNVTILRDGLQLTEAASPETLGGYTTTLRGTMTDHYTGIQEYSPFKVGTSIVLFILQKPPDGSGQDESPPETTSMLSPSPCVSYFLHVCDLSTPHYITGTQILISGSASGSPS